MTEGINKLIETLKRAASGENIDVQYVRTITFDPKDRIVEKAANTSWMRLRHFADDIDIRSRDPDYEKQMRQEMDWRWRELVDLLAAQR